MKKVILLITVSLLLVSCLKKVNTDEDKINLLNNDKKLNSAINRYGPAEAYRMFLSDSALISPNMNAFVKGKDNITDFLNIAAKSIKVTLDPAGSQIHYTGDIGYTWGYLTLYSTEEKESFVYGKYMNIWIRERSGDWKLAAHMGNKAPAPEFGKFK